MRGAWQKKILKFTGTYICTREMKANGYSPGEQ